MKKELGSLEVWAQEVQSPEDGLMALTAFVLMQCVQDIAAGIRQGFLGADLTVISKVRPVEKYVEPETALKFLRSADALGLCDMLRNWSNGRFRITPDGLLAQARRLGREGSAWARNGQLKHALTAEEKVAVAAARKARMKAYQKSYQAEYKRTDRGRKGVAA